MPGQLPLLIYNSTGTATKRVWTLTSSGTIPRDEIDFGIKGADFYEGCHIAWTAGEILVVYKD